MSLKCIHCKKDVDDMTTRQSMLMQSSIDNDWYVDLILACPHCGQQYNAFVSVLDFEPLEAPGEN